MFNVIVQLIVSDENMKYKKKLISNNYYLNQYIYIHIYLIRLVSRAWVMTIITLLQYMYIILLRT